LHREFRVVVAQVLELGRAVRISEARDAYLAQAKPIADRLDRRVGELVHKSETAIFDAIDANHLAAARSAQLLAALAAAAVFVASVLGFALSLSIIRPVRDMEAAFQSIAGGDFSPRVIVPNRDELGTLATNLNHMTADLGSAYARIDAANRNKSEFLANMSHELRTPLNAIIGFSEVLLQRYFGEINAKQEDYLKDILGSGQHQLSLVNDILDLSKVEAGKLELDRGPVKLPELIDASVLLVAERAARHSITLAVNVDPNVGDFPADARKLKQILVNLLSNAVKYTPDGGRVNVSAERRDGEVCVSVQDTGVGIAPDDQERIFEEFQQTGIGRQTEGSTGLGLSLARRLVQLHGGRIWVESTVGAGSRFIFTLPVTPVADERTSAVALQD
jgi:signal transduction histidine kinase